MLAIDTLRRVAATRGAAFRYESRVAELTARGLDTEAYVEVATGDNTFRAHHLVVTAGAWAPGLLRGIIDLPTLRVTQEQPAHFRPWFTQHEWPSFVHWRSGDALNGADAYGLLSPGEGVKLGLHGTGPVIDPDDRDFEPTAQGIDALQAYVRHWIPGVDANSIEPVSCLYDNAPNDDFIIDRRGPITFATGFSGHGFKFTPVIGLLLADLVAERSGTPSRFGLAR